ncbi:extracellular solute-binding protein [Jatrophihabitans cynanchi]|jgi:multiple sugar transport system substrate-binding protein|uniref:Extracellular solute-binding protein n=1 Tax=Jatrophihabitans cynanchi TaxID=2944128 RepID=A0ABY7JX79_9ACTN|nr:extracellular solute-binding protein [Jatrophihabitans sp. SB3-54]WAX55927.1 extracellular solute-binding protein [Jatrophihabitans sp. SB3-54]
MKRRLLGAVSLALTAALTITGCGSSGGGGGTNGTTTLKLVAADYGTGPENTSQKYWQDIADAFHKQNPKITVKVQTINWNDFDDQVKTMVQNHNYPDITEGDYFPDFAQAKLLYPAKDVMSDSTFKNLIPVFANLGTYNGTQYGMPFTTSSRTMFYNKKLFTQAGIANPPQTWDDVKTDALKIKALGKVGFGLPLGKEEAQAETLLWMLGNGGGYQDNGKWTIDSSQNVETMQFLADLVKSGATEPNPGTKNRTDLWKQFASGDIGMINGQGALIPIIKSGGKLSDADWASVPIPGKTGPLDKTLGVCDNVSAFNGNGHQAQIKAFLDFAYQDTYQVAFDKEYDLLPATNSGVQALSSDPVFAPFLKALPNSVQYPNDPVWSTVKSQIQTSIGTIVSKDPKSVLSALQQTATKGS